MAGYFGTEQQIKLQQRAEERYGWTMKTPGACCNVRTERRVWVWMGA